MTFMLDPKPPQRVASGLTGGLAEGWESFSARWQASSLEGGARNFEDAVVTRDVSIDRTQQAAEKIGLPALQEAWSFTDAAKDPLLGAKPETIDDFINQHLNGRIDIDEIARKAAEQNPDAWSDIDMSDEALEASSNERMKQDYDELQQIIAMSPENWARDMAAEFGSGTLNVKTAPALLLGGFTSGGSWLAIAGREAAINVGIETTLLPKQFEIADTLDIAEPKVVQQLSQAALFGAGFGLGFEAIGRGLRYVAGRARIRPPGMPAVEGEILTQRLESAMTGPRPFEAVGKILDEEMPPAPAPPEGMVPLSAASPEVRWRQADPELAYTYDTLTRRQADFRAKIEADQAAVKADLDAARTGAEGRLSSLTDELSEVRGDKLARDRIKGDIKVTQGDLLEMSKINTAEGTPATAAMRAELMSIDEQLRDLAPRIAAAREASVSTPDRPVSVNDAVIDPAAIRRSEGPAWRKAVRREVEDALRRSGEFDRISPRVREEIIHEAQERGGSVENLVEAAHVRTMDWVDDASRGSTASPEGQGRGRAAAAGPVAGEARGSARGVGRRDADAGAGGAARGVDETASFGGEQNSLFDDPAGPKAEPFHQQMTSDLRDVIEADGDFMVDMDDGKGERTASSVLDDLDQGDMFASRIALCGMGS